MEKRRKRTIYIDPDIDKQMRVAAVEGEHAEEAFRLFLIKDVGKRILNDVSKPMADRPTKFEKF